MKIKIILIGITIISVILCVIIVTFNTFNAELSFNDNFMIDKLYCGMDYNDMIEEFGENDLELGSGFVIVGYHLDNDLILTLNFETCKYGLQSANIMDFKNYSEEIPLYKISRSNIKKVLIFFIIVLVAYMWIRWGRQTNVVRPMSSG